MQLEAGELFHIYNRGNNSDRVFYTRENYLFFLGKATCYLKPYCDIIAWCLMPNHFHFLVKINRLEISIENSALNEVPDNSQKPIIVQRTLNHSVGIMLRSYANAIQKQEKRTGSLFQKQTKAVLITEDNRFSPTYFNTAFGAMVNMGEYKSYAETCFHYIHNNPKAAGIVAKNEDWEFSSYRDYAGLRDGRLVNKELGREYFNSQSTI